MFTVFSFFFRLIILLNIYSYSESAMCRSFTRRCLKIATIASLCILLVSSLCRSLSLVYPIIKILYIYLSIYRQQFSLAEVGVNIAYILNQTFFRTCMILSSVFTIIFMIIISTIGIIVLFGQNRLRPFIVKLKEFLKNHFEVLSQLLNLLCFFNELKALIV